MDFNLVKFRYDLNEQTIALYSNILNDELIEILSSVLPIIGKILGIQGQDKTIVPISLVCKNPHILNDSVYDIITTESNKNNINNNSNNNNKLLPSAPPLENFNSNQNNQQSIEEEESLPLTNNVFTVLSRIINNFNNEGLISRVEKEALEYLLNIRSTLLPAAYSVASYTDDSQFLLTSCTQIAKNMMTSAGQSVCTAQEDILQCCDQLYINTQIDERQLVYLRYLVLLRDEKITDLYDEFQLDRNPEDLIRGLCFLAGVSLEPKLINKQSNRNDFPNNNIDYNQDQDQEEEEDDDDDYVEEEEEEESSDDESSDDNEEEEEDNNDSIQLNIHQLKALIRRLSLTPVQGFLMSNMIDDNDSRFNKLYQEYLKHNNLERLQSDMIQLAKDEDRIIRENENQDVDNSDNNEENDDDDDDEEEENSNDDDEENNIEIPQSPTATSRLEILLNSLNETNQWKNSVPSRFVLAVFAAAQKKLLTIGHARGLCDLFQAGNELVHAAWEVFDSQGDVIDFIDTLRRIVYKATHLNLNNNNEDEDDDNEDNEEDNDDEYYDNDDDDNDNENNDENNKSGSDSSDSTVPRMKRSNSSDFNINTVEVARNEALQAVTSAKRDLLKHSLDLLAKQGLITESAAINLFQKSLTEDCGTDDAIEEYASNKDMIVFLEKLVNLANGINPSEILQQNSNDNTLSQKEVLYISGALTTIADHLLTESIITKNAHDTLKTLIQQKNSQLFNIWLSYRENKCELTSIVDLMIQLSSQNNQKNTPANTNPDDKKVLSIDDYKNIIDIYVRAQALTIQEKEILYILIESKNSQLTQSFYSFENHRDVHKLLNELKQIASSPPQPTTTTTKTSQSQSQNSEGDTSSKFLSVVKKMNLSRDETIALRDAIANDDPLLRSALELYRSDQNEDHLITNLRAICKRLLTNTSSSLSLSPSKSNTNTKSTSSSSTTKTSLSTKPQESTKNSVSPPIQDIFPILLNELIREAIFTPQEGTKLFQLYQNNDEVMAAALDLYELDHDLAGFVGSLEKILNFI